MNKPTSLILLTLLSAVVMIAFEGTLAAPAVAVIAHSSSKDTRLTQLFYPPASDRQIVAVTGQGRARVPADLARINVGLTNRNPGELAYTRPEMTNARPEMTKPPQPQASPEPITKATLTDFVNALKRANVPESNIKVIINPLEINKYGSSNSSNAAIMIELNNPTQERINQIVIVLNSAVARKSNRPKIYLEDVAVQYTVNSCVAIEDAAYLAAMKDAKLRANALAKSMGVQLADLPSVAELPFLGRFYSPCSQDPDIAGAIFRRSASPYNPNLPAEVEIYREIAVTYRIR